jgi:hypothetical protein
MAYCMNDTRKGREVQNRIDRKEKRVRKTDDEVRNLLFECFEQTNYWKRKALINHTQQPDSAVQKILGEIAEKVTTGDFKNHWKLKP